MAEFGDGFDVDTTELAECAQLNFRNVVKINPGIGADPIFMMAMMQLDAVVARLVKADEVQ